ncbi:MULTISPECIES: helix-turn-helix domain-containing protein [unclassified Bradyrhizobium]|uniref:helix-turn-helix domain-containing protein n=1 Tax=unclassified Bradyrhizobium TaxID=2631580 RepID=UPI00247A0C73|nr:MULTISPECIES: helix-turn-helix domain-containing protein [unclassified Bradyrhizobium]WGR93630.1 helix-turn-helix domain-containing protein [Bradyrhizobium sp. ISRA435]WGR98201.1 helix-turn-helix domain-containing protein [Bradyrhizobium sp. ISRA436]WGS05090.1 helix-turn-helix domain-containing protein [Bradyrhizobium sp. ISRA437]WGS11975.1 helix-turn-helix domain-containing protein [Bradyrhizobium sp. ISRA443]WGS19437.1 helix-turn-helix domain-containing protein [Bradyrhizobium sp. ISRA463
MLMTAANSQKYSRSLPLLRSGVAQKDSPRALMGAAMRFARNAEIYGEDEPAEYLYQAISGAVRTYRMLDDGRRQICGFYLPGDIFGVEAGEVHLSSAEALNDAEVLVVKRSSLMARAEREKDFAAQLWTLTVRELQRVQEHSLVLIKSAEERVAGFLLEMSGRSCRDAVIELPMSRRDIADYLGLTIETVSRTFTQFVQSGIITLETSRRIQLRDEAVLNRLNA